jgi:RNA polymerase sigma-70 factor (ECF subfamily)
MEGRADVAESESFEAFYATAYRRIVGQVFALLGDVHEAEDVTQDAFAKASFHWKRISAYDQPEAWVRRVAFNLAYNRTRRARRWLVAVARIGPPEHVPAVSADRLDLHRAMRRPVGPPRRRSMLPRRRADLLRRSFLVGLAGHLRRPFGGAQFRQPACP